MHHASMGVEKMEGKAEGQTKRMGLRREMNNFRVPSQLDVNVLTMGLLEVGL